MQIDEYDRSKLIYGEYEIKNYLGEEMLAVRIFIENLEAGIKYLKDNNIKNFTVSTLHFEKKQTIDLGFLKDFKNTKYLCIAVPLSKKTDITPIYQLENLEGLWTIEGFQLDMNYFPRLKSLLAGDLLKDTISHESLTELIRLYLSPKKDLKLLEKLQSLEYIGIFGNKVESLNGLRTLPKLKEVMIQNTSNLVNIDDIALNSDIKDIFFENTKRLTDFSILAKNRSIEELRLATTIDSLEFVPKMKSLKSITFSNVKDGNLEPLLESKTLEDVYFYPEKKHYTHKLDEINKILQSRQR